MLATERLLVIEKKIGNLVDRIVPIELDGETIRLVLHLKDGTNLRVTEQWSGNVLERYSYYWLTPANELRIGWDNAPHHTRVENYPHHKHVGREKTLQASYEICLEDVMNVVLKT